MVKNIHRVFISYVPIRLLFNRLFYSILLLKLIFHGINYCRTILNILLLVHANALSLTQFIFLITLHLFPVPFCVLRALIIKFIFCLCVAMIHTL